MLRKGQYFEESQIDEKNGEDKSSKNNKSDQSSYNDTHDRHDKENVLEIETNISNCAVNAESRLSEDELIIGIKCC